MKQLVLIEETAPLTKKVLRALEKMRPPEKRSAVFSDDRVYRYTLDIVWDESLPLVQFIGLNPSTADEFKDDNTVRKCKQFARNWGYGGMVMTNLFAYRDTDPRGMKKHPQPAGERNGAFCRDCADAAEFGYCDDGLPCTSDRSRNDYFLRSVAERCQMTVAAWGNHGEHRNRGAYVAGMFQRKLDRPLKCFRITNAGQPEHPLYMPYTQQLIDYVPRGTK
jgi:hypothetical protein